MTATGFFSDGSTRDLTRTAKWSTGNAKVASVNGSGLVTGTGFGQTSITAASGSVQGSTGISVSSPIG
jgi:trimeric autotransporter adhesin